MVIPKCSAVAAMIMWIVVHAVLGSGSSSRSDGATVLLKDTVAEPKLGVNHLHVAHARSLGRHGADGASPLGSRCSGKFAPGRQQFI
jgi:hypothetical protein